MSHLMVYVTTKDSVQAKEIATTVVKERLAACANIMPAMTSVYWWEGAINESSEAVLILKTTDDVFDKLRRRIKELHSYEVPCVIGWPITQGDTTYLSWLEENTKA